MSLFLYQDQTFSIPPGRWKGFRLAGRQPVCTAGLVQEDNTNFSELPWFVIIHHHSLQFFPYVPLQWHAMTILIQFGNIRGIFGVYHGFSLLVSPLITMTSIFGRQHSAHHGTMAPWRCLGDASMPRQWPRAISHTPAFIFASRHPWLCLLVDLFICYIPRINC